MGGLFSSLSAASQNLDAQRYGLDVTGQNIANLNTEGYARRRVDLAERLPNDGVGGVDVVGVRAVRDAFVDQRLRTELPGQGKDDAMASSLAVVENSLGAAGSSVDSALGGLFDSFAALALDPQSSAARHGVVQAATTLAVAFNDMSAQLTQARAQADADVRGSVTQINDLATNIAHLNQQIADAPSNVDTSALKDALSLSLEKLSALAPVGVVTQASGTVDVSLGNGRALVVGVQSYALNVTNAAGTGMAEVRGADGTNITAELTSGKIGGLLQVRDTMIPSYETQLNQLATDVMTAVNNQQAAGFDLNGNTGPMLYMPIPPGQPPAGVMQVNQAVATDPSKIAASSTGAVGDNGNAKAMAALRDAKSAVGGSTTFTEAWGLITNKVGSDVVSVKHSQGTRGDVISALTQLRDSVSGVSLDEEAGRLMQFQRAYEANARYFSAVDTMLQTLLTTIGAR